MQPVTRYLKLHYKRFVRELVEFASFPSISAQPDHRRDLRRCAAWLRDHCRGIGLEARLHETAGHPVVVARTRRRGASARPHFLIYGHYDVQPPDPLELWSTPPFRPTLRRGALYARGASDNKGQHFAHLKAAEAYLKTGTPLPCDLTFVLEGEEEIGSSNLPRFLRQQRRQLRCDAVVISDNGIPDKDHPALTYALRGIAALEVRVDGPARDLHSGIHGGAVNNPAHALCELLAKLKTPRGRINIPGYYRDVRPLSALERKQFAKFPISPADYRRALGVPALFGESGFTAHEQRTARPTLEVNGLTSGYQGEGSKTIIPAWACAKLTLRLVPDQDPAKALRLVCDRLKELCPPSVRLTLKSGHGGKPYLTSPSSRLAQASLRALEQAFQRPPMLMREGGSIPIVNEFARTLGVDVLLLGLALPDDNPHSPNEKFDLECFRAGMEMSAILWPELSAAVTATGG